MKLNDIGQSSRGSDEEKQLLIEDLTHQEQHMAEVIEKHPDRARELSKELDEIRKTRQLALKTFYGNSVDVDFHCSLKHSGMAHLRGQEILNNASRIEKEKAKDIAVLNERLTHHRDYALKKYRSGKKGGKCARCASDAAIITNESPQILNTRNQNVSYKRLRKQNRKKNKNGDNMAKAMKVLKSAGTQSLGQLGGQAGVYASEKIEEKWFADKSTGTFRAKNLLNVLGGAAIAVGPSLLSKRANFLTGFTETAGTHMLAVGVADMAREQFSGAGTARLRARTLRVSPQGVSPALNPHSPKVALF